MDTFAKISSRIIKEQELIIGPVAWDEARKVSGLNVVDPKNGSIELVGDGKTTVDLLVSRYVRLFGKTSQEVCKDAVQDLLGDLKPEEVPMALK